MKEETQRDKCTEAQSGGERLTVVVLNLSLTPDFCLPSSDF